MIHLSPSDISPEAPDCGVSGAHLTAATPSPFPLTDGSGVAAVFSSRGLADVLQERLHQVEKHGHTPAADALLPLIQFQVGVMRMAHGITRPGALDAREKLRRKLVQLAAFCLAFIDRIDGHQPNEGTPQ